MEKKALTLLIAVMAGILIGVTLAVQRTTNPIIIEQLSGISKSAKNLETLPEISAYLKNMNDRLVRLEVQSNSFMDLAKNMKFPAPVAGQQPSAPQPPAEDYSKVHNLDMPTAKILGRKDAPITIVEFVDFQCPFCLRFHPAVDEVMKAYPKDVNYVLRNFPLPFHPQARPAAKAALAAGEQGKYYEMVDQLLKSASSLNEEKFKELAKSLGLNVSKFLKDYKDKDAQWEEIIKKDMILASQVDVRGTPTYYINGRKTMARDFNSFKIEVDKLLSELKRK